MTSNITNKAVDIHRYLSSHYNLGKYVDSKYELPEVHTGSGRIKLIILGQDPTVKSEESRKYIKKVLNLDKPGRLKAYLSNLCSNLGVNLDVNAYATNYFKNFFINPPTQIEDINVFQVFEPYWLPVLIEEVERYPNIPIISLGQPLLRTVVKPGGSACVRDYWGYKLKWKSGERGIYKYLEPELNKIGRVIFPFPHQPSINKQFYRDRLAEYITFVKRFIE